MPDLLHSLLYSLSLTQCRSRQLAQLECGVDRQVDANLRTVQALGLGQFNPVFSTADGLLPRSNQFSIAFIGLFVVMTAGQYVFAWIYAVCDLLALSINAS